MAYFLGRDVDVYITTEADKGVYTDFVNSAAALALAPADATEVFFAAPRASGTAGMINGDGRVTDLTGVDLSIGAVDEDVTYFGRRMITKAEIKKETTVTLTRKSMNNCWDAIYQNARFGGSGSTIYDGLEEPRTTTGYRLHVVLKPTGNQKAECFSVKGSIVSAHTKTLGADAVTEETLEFVSMITPAVASGATTGILTDAEL